MNTYQIVRNIDYAGIRECEHWQLKRAYSHRKGVVSKQGGSEYWTRVLHLR